MKLIEGVKYNKESDHFDFIWTQDSPEDLINLKLQKYNKLLSTKDGNSIYYAYKFNLDADKKLVDDLKKSIKYVDNKVSESDVDLMISKSVNSFNALVPISSFDVIVTPKSTSKVLDLLKNFLQAKAGSNTLVSSDVFIKNTIDNVQFDEEKLSKLKPEDRVKIEKILRTVFSKEDYKIRSLSPRYRKFVLNFMKFNTDLEKRIMNRLVGGKVLVIDDILTEGTTIKNIVALLNSINSKEVISFVLLASKK